MNNTGVQSIGIKCPIIKEGDDLCGIVVESILDTFKKYDVYHDTCYYDIEDKDIIGITESVVARNAGLYLSLDDLTQEIKDKCPSGHVMLMNPIYSRNRFSMILKAFARACEKLYIVMPDFDEVGNPCGLNPNTGVNIMEYYKQLCEENNCECIIGESAPQLFYDMSDETTNSMYIVDCALRPNPKRVSITTLKDFGTKLNPTYGLLGSNKANEETLKLFPTVDAACRVCTKIQRMIKEATNKHVEVMVYGDGCFKDATSGIWEFADPDVSPFYTEGLDGSPNEIKLKAFADDKFNNLHGDMLNAAIKNEINTKANDLVGSMNSQGTTPRKYVNLLASLMDLTSGSGDKGTPVVVVKNYFKNYASE
jgi:hypothetical protein